MMPDGKLMADLIASLKEGDEVRVMIGRQSALIINGTLATQNVLRDLQPFRGDLIVEEELVLQWFYLMGVLFDAALRLRGLALSLFEGRDHFNRSIDYFQSEIFREHALPRGSMDEGRLMHELKSLILIAYKVVRA